jgi:hypothetical protein
MAVTQGGQSALVRCCKSNRRELAVLLVESGADINSTDEVSFRNNLLYRTMSFMHASISASDKCA